MKAIVMAGGEGTRLRPLTCAVPKPMVPILDKPMLEYTLEHLLNHGITQAALTLGYLPTVVTNYFDEHRPKRMELDYYIEDVPLGTAGSVKNAASFVDGTFLILSGDALTDIDLTQAVSEHKKSGAKATIVLKRMGDPQGYGVVITSKDGTVERFVEKPGWEDVFSDAINTGLYILEPEVLELIPAGKKFDFAKDLFPLMMSKGLAIHGHITEGYWCDVGSIESYIRAHEDLLSGTVKAVIRGHNIGGIWVGDGVKLSGSALMQSPAFVGAGASIGDGARIGRYSCIGAGARVGAYADLKRSVVHGGARVGRHTKLRGCVVASGSAVGERCSVLEGAVVGERSMLGQDSRVAPRVRLWPEKSIGLGASANETIVWGHGERAGMIGRAGFVGDLGVDLTPLKLSRIFGAVGEYLSGKSVALCSDGTDVCGAAAKQAAGIFTLSGVDVCTCSGVPRPVLALTAEELGASLCVSLRTYKQRLYVDIFEPGLFMLSKAARKKIEERYFYQGEQLANPECGKETWMGTAGGFYCSAISKKADWSRISKSGIRVTIGGMREIDNFLERVLLACDAKPIRDAGRDIFEAVREESADFGVRMGKDGIVAALYTPEGRMLKTDECHMLWYYLVFSSFNKESICLPSGVLRGVTALADIFGIRYDFTSEEEALTDLSPDQRRLLSDGFFAVCRLAEHIARTGTNIDELAAVIAPPHVKVKTISCDFEDIGRVIGSVYELGGAYANEGLRLETGEGCGYICPHATRPTILIRTEADTEEFAAELCESYADMVRKIIQKKPVQ